MISMELSSHKLAHILDAEWKNGSANGSLSSVDLQFDSREIAKGQVFWAIIGDKYDAHAYLDQVKKCGAFGAVISAETSYTIPSNFPVLPVDDTFEALYTLAQNWATSLNTKRVAITGSNGKTTTKEMLRTILSQNASVLATQKNENNHFGVPFTLLKITKEHQYAVIEMGTSGPGEISPLSLIANPHIAIITHIGPGHLLGLGTVEDVYNEKVTIENGLVGGGALIVNGDDVLLKRLRSNKSRRVLRAGIEGGDVSPSHIEWDDHGCAIITVQNMQIHLQVPGEHNVRNALLAITACIELNIPMQQIAKGLSEFTGVAGRMQSTIHNGVEYIDDTYNANPLSMLAALKVVEKKVDAAHRCVALGDMLELGEESEKHHRDLGRWIAASQVKQFLAYGPQMAWAADEAIKNGLSASSVCATQDVSAAIAWIKSSIQTGDCLLFKGSRGMKMEKILQGVQA